MTSAPSPPPRKAWANAKANAEFIDLQTYSGYRSSTIDETGKNHDLSPAVSEEELGDAVLDALVASRFLAVEDMYRLNEQAQPAYERWVANKLTRHGYKNRRALFREMKTCSIELQDGLITIVPWHHDKLEGWDGRGISSDMHVVIDSTSGPAEIGAALRLAFSRCT